MQTEPQTQVRIDRIIGAETITVSIVDQDGMRAAGLLSPAQAREFAAALTQNADLIEASRPMVWIDAYGVKHPDGPPVDA